MIRGSFLFLLIAITAGVLGFTGMAGEASFIAKFLSVVFVGSFVVSTIGALGHQTDNIEDAI